MSRHFGTANSFVIANADYFQDHVKESFCLFVSNVALRYISDRVARECVDFVYSYRYIQ